MHRKMQFLQAVIDGIGQIFYGVDQGSVQIKNSQLIHGEIPPFESACFHKVSV